MEGLISLAIWSTLANKYFGIIVEHFHLRSVHCSEPAYVFSTIHLGEFSEHSQLRDQHVHLTWFDGFLVAPMIDQTNASKFATLHQSCFIDRVETNWLRTICFWICSLHAICNLTEQGWTLHLGSLIYDPFHQVQRIRSTSHRNSAWETLHIAMLSAFKGLECTRKVRYVQKENLEVSSSLMHRTDNDSSYFLTISALSVSFDTSYMYNQTPIITVRCRKFWHKISLRRMTYGTEWVLSICTKKQFFSSCNYLIVQG